MARKIEVQIVGDASKLEKTFGKVSNSASGFGQKMQSVGKYAAIGLAGVATGAVVAGKRMVEMASDAEEVRSKMEVVFGKSLPKLNKNLDAFSEATGASRYELREQAADMGALLKPLVGTRDKAADMSAQFVKLATDLGSFNNVPTADALLAIRSGLVGEAEPLRRFGVLLNEAAVKAEGLRLGLVKGREEMTEQEKVQARASLIMQQTTLAQGDATRTAGSMANQMKALRANIEDAATSIGIALIPYALRAVQAFNQHWPEIQRVAGQVFGALRSAIDALRPTFAWLQTAFQTVARFAQQYWPQVQAAAQRVVAWYQGTLRPAIQNVISALQAIWAKFGADITRIASTAFNTAKTVITAALRVIQGVVEGVLAAIRGDWSQAWNSLKQVVSNTFAIIKALIAGFGTAAFIAMQSVGRAMIDGVVAGLSGLFNAVKDKIVGGIRSAISAAGGILHGSGDFHITKHLVGKPLADGIVEGLDGGLALLAPKMQERIKQAMDRVKAQIDLSKTQLGAAMSSLSDKLLRAFDAKTSGTMTPAEQEIASINARRRLDDLNRAMQEALETGDAAVIARAQEDLHLHSLEQQAAQERKAWDDERSAMRERLEGRLSTLGKHFAKEGDTVAKAMLKINEIMRAFGITFAESGELVGKHFAAGLASAVGGAAVGAGGVRGAMTGGSLTPKMPAQVTQIILDGKVVAETVRKENAVYQRANGVLAV